MPQGETLLGRQRNQLVRPLADDCAISDKRKQYGAECQGHSQRRRMSHPTSLSDFCTALCQCLIRKAEAEKDDPQAPLCPCKRAVGDLIVKRKHLFQMRPGRRKPADIHQGSTGGIVAQNEPGGIVALTAQTQQILTQALRQIEFPANHI
jgi:hypothetical protein